MKSGILGFLQQFPSATAWPPAGADSEALAADFRALLNWFQQCGDWISADALHYYGVQHPALQLENLGWLVRREPLPHFGRFVGPGYAPAGALLAELESIRVGKTAVNTLVL